ncbi:MAG: 2Fe-2S iron-sulfur cluster binding domain-containing protein [Saprospiraceae bacterium]|nr:2Fe-2S iron-sulfur cluster binding domain-containing protein [Saprospiraceae bacterium]
MSQKHFYALKVKDIEKETNNCVVITFDVPKEISEVFAYKPGQYLTLKRNINEEDIRRSYSICSAPYENKLCVAVKKLEGGRFSTYINDVLKVGDAIEVMPPMGNFILHSPVSHQNIIFFAAGSGITPIIAIIKHLLHTNPDINVVLFYGNRNFESIIFREELEGIKNLYMTRFALYHIFTKEKIGIPLFYGRLDALKCNDLTTKLISVKKSDVFMLCGPAQMIFEVKETLISLGVSSDHIHFELFNTDGIIKTTDSKIASSQTIDSNLESKVSIKMDGDIFDFEVNYNGLNLLDAALLNGADLPYACKGGVCSTCKAKLIEGNVIMELNFALEQDELDAGYILMCQSHPRSANILVDFDQK